MTQPLNLALTLSLNDRLVAPLQRALGDAQRTLRDVSRELDGVGRTGAQAAQGLQQIGRQAEGVRTATREVRALGQAADDAERRVSRLGSVFGTLRNVTRGVVGLTAGGAAVGAALAGPVQRAADYDTQLRNLSNTAFAGQPLAQRREGMRSLDASIIGAVRAGGGTRDGAMEALNALVASGAFGSAAEASSVLPLLMRGATASGASAAELANIAIRGQQTFGLRGPQMAATLDMAMAAGQAGGFELRDMAKWLPAQMAAARSLGLSGPEGMVKLLAANQASAITAGSKDEAGNNLVNLLAKVNSADTAADFKKLGIDLPGSLAAARGNGVDGLSAFVNMVDQLVAKDDRFQKARRGAASSDSAERAASYGAQADILQGSAVGKVVQDRQALMALVALMNNRDYVKDVAGKVRNSSGAIGNAFDLMSEGPGFKFQQREAEVQRAQIEAMSSANSVITRLAEAQTKLYRQYPGFGEAVEGARVALLTLTATAAAVGAARLLLGGAGGAAGAGAAAGVGKAVAAGGAAGLLARGGAVGLAGAAGYGAGTLLYQGALAGTKVGDGVGEFIAQIAAFFGSQEAQSSLNANRAADAATRMLAAVEKFEGITIKVKTDTPLWTAEIMRDVARDARRN